MITLASLILIGGAFKSVLWAIDSGHVTGERFRQQAEWVETMLLNRRRHTRVLRWRTQR